VKIEIKDAMMAEKAGITSQRPFQISYNNILEDV
jgi:hypothetical protein